MRVTILTVGTRGDVQPLLALGLGLERAGHRVCVATHPKFELIVRRAGLDFAPLAEGRISAGPATQEGRRWIEADSRRLPSWVGLLRDARSVGRRRLTDAMSACAGADAIVASDLATLLGWQMSEHFGRPLVLARLFPRGPLIEPASDPIAAAGRQALWLAARPWLNRVRRDVDLPALPRREPFGEADGRGALVLAGFSPALLPRAARSKGRLEATGFWLLDRDLDPDPPPALLAFLAAGPPPVAIGFGSNFDSDPVRTTELAVEALRRSGCRGILIRGQNGLRGGDLPENVLAVDTVAYSWLVPRCAAVVHHAGTGTVGAVLQAGVPSVSVPQWGSQLRVARRLHRLGVATAPIPRRRLTAQRLHEAIAEAAGDPVMRERSARLGEQIRLEDGVGQAVAALERYMRGRAGAGAREARGRGKPAGQFDHQEVSAK